MTKFFLILVYWLVLVPVGVARRLLGIGKYQPSPAVTDGSYWRSRSAADAPSVRYRKQL